MRKFFILTLMVASLMMVSCVEKRNLVTLDKFIPIRPEDNCEIKPGGQYHQMEGMIDLAFTSDYVLAFQITNNIPSDTGSSSGSSLATTETNYFYADKVEIEYDWWPKTQEKTDGQPRLKLDQSLWNKNTRTMEYPIMATPNGGQFAGYVHVFNDAQAKDLLKNVLEEAPTFDWIQNPLTVKIRVIGELADGTEVKTNQLKIGIRPNFGETIQGGAVYWMPKKEPEAKTDDNGKVIRTEEQVIWDYQHEQCTFGDTIMNGCLAGQDTSQVNCWSGDTAWHKYIVEKYCKEEPCHNYTAGNGAADVIYMIYNSYKKTADDTGYYFCCPLEEKDEPEDPEEDDNSSAGA